MRNKIWVIAILLCAGLLAMPSTVAARQETATAPVSVDVTVPTPEPNSTTSAPVNTPTAVPTAVPTAQPTAAPPIVTTTQTPILTPTPVQTPAETATTYPTVLPSLSVGISPVIECALSSDEETVEQGGSIDYRCAIEVTASDSGQSEEQAQLDWSLSASAGEGWSVALRLPDQSWGGSSGTLNDRRTFDPGSQGTETLIADVRITRQSCVTAAQTVQLTSQVEVALLDASGAITGSSVQGTSAGIIVPALAPITEPELSFSGSLDFGQVTPDSWGAEASASGEITLMVSGLQSSCGDWTIVLSGSVLQAANGSTIPVGSLSLTGVNGMPISSGGCPLSGGCLVGDIVTGPRAVDTESFTLRLVLTVPAGTLSGSFSSSITASIVAD